MEQNNYSITIKTKLSYESAIEKTTEALKEQGFGVLTEIDVKATLKKKIDVDFRPYKILGACNPPFAHKALTAEPNIGALLPCNIVVSDEGDFRQIVAMEPKIMSQMIDNPALVEIAGEVSGRIHKVMQKLEAY